MTYNIDFHVHTNKSMDGVSSLEDIIASAKVRGLNGLVVTDHNLCTDVRDYQKSDFLVIPGCEVSTQVGHITALFIKKEIPIQKLWKGQLPSLEEAVSAIHQSGGLAIIAHPFQKANRTYTENQIKLVDGIEIYNARACFKNKNANQMAHDLANKYNCIKLAGSDAHSMHEVGNAYVVVKAEKLDEKSIRQAVIKGNVEAKLIKDTPHYRKGISQFVKAVRTRKVVKIIKAMVYVVYCIVLDIIKK